MFSIETEATKRLVHVCSYHSLHLCLSPVLLISANPDLSFFSSFIFNPPATAGAPTSFMFSGFYVASVCLMDEEWREHLFQLLTVNVSYVVLEELAAKAKKKNLSPPQ